jgi:hypothetical protein
MPVLTVTIPPDKTEFYSLCSNENKLLGAEN